MGFSIQEHAKSMRQTFPGLKISRFPDGTVAWEGEVTPAGKSYRIRIKCRIGWTPEGKHEILGRPHVDILSPEPRRREDAPDEEIPHLEYRERPGLRALCLYDQGGNEWHSGIAIAEMVPWISEWLLCYEIWHAIGTWTCG